VFWKYRSALILAAAIVAGFSIPALGQAPENPFRGQAPLVPPPADTPNPFPEPTLDSSTAALLDPLLEKRDWLGIRKAVQRVDDPTAFSHGLNWLKVHTDTGAPFVVPLLYSENLWIAGDTSKVDGLQAQAALMALYTVALIRMDGLACGDTTAPSRRFDQLLNGPAGLALRYAAKLEPEKQAQMIKLAVGLEAATASRRPAEDETLCRGGMEELKAGMDANNLGKPHPEPGHIGNVVAVTPPPDFKPSYRPQGEYEKQRTALRGAELYDYLWKLIGSR
jgi:hypothetical protein